MSFQLCNFLSVGVMLCCDSLNAYDVHSYVLLHINNNLRYLFSLKHVVLVICNSFHSEEEQEQRCKHHIQ